MMFCIRRANLDALWSQEKLTVSTNLKNVRKACESLERVNMRMPFKPLGPMPINDITGHRAAIQMLLCSLEEGTYSKDYKQFDTIQKMRSSFLNAWGALAKGMTFNVLEMKTGKRIHSPNAQRTLNGSEGSTLDARSAWVRTRLQLGLLIDVVKEYMDQIKMRWLLAT
jgi:hypothetical protein